MAGQDKKKYKVGMFGGKFMPFHKGHFYCIDVAASQCEKVYVLLFSGGDQENKILINNPGVWYLSIEDRQKHIESAIRKYNNVVFYTIDITGCRNPDGGIWKHLLYVQYVERWVRFMGVNLVIKLILTGHIQKQSTYLLMLKGYIIQLVGQQSEIWKTGRRGNYG